MTAPFILRPAARLLRKARTGTVSAAKQAAIGLASVTGRPLSRRTRLRLRRVAQAVLPGTRELAELKLGVDNLWGGFSSHALVDLDALAANGQADAEARAGAAYALAQWHHAHGDLGEALRRAESIWTLDVAKSDTFVAIRFDCLFALGKFSEARTFLLGARRNPERTDHGALRLANSLFRPGEPACDGGRLAVLNRLYARCGFGGLALREEERGLRIDNLRALSPDLARSLRGPLVSVVMPVFNAAQTLPVALRSLQEQSWADLEIIVVDDCSSDGTAGVADGLAAADPRIRVVRQAANEGAYAARNRGLAEAAGAFVTTHDADDWSHPQKIAFQVADLMKGKGASANVTFWARATPELAFTGTLRPSRELVVWNHSSFMAPHAAFDRIGGWDRVRAGGDTEFIWRFEQVYGKAAKREIGRGAPLSFALNQPHSLTRAGVTHAFTIYHGARREYREAAQHWHAATPPEKLFVDPAGGARTFPAPAALTTKTPASVELDTLFVMDFALQGGAFVSTLNMIQAAVAAGKRVGILHWARPALGAARTIRPLLRDMAQQGRLRIVAAGESLTVDTVIVGYPPILAAPLDRLPRPAFRDLVVVVNQMAYRLRGGRDPQYDPAAVRLMLRDLFGTEGRWAAISGQVRRLMAEDGRYPPAEPEIWTPLIDTATWCRRLLEWRGAKRARPVIGRHGRDHPTKWPRDAAALRAAYCAGGPCDMRILGGAAHALDKLWFQPRNWTVRAFGSTDVQEFLGDLDFFVHYPDEDYIEEFGRAVLEAMAVGVPVIVPDVFRETFGAAATYAAPEEVWPAVDALWRDGERYLERARAGRRFVFENCDWKAFAERMAALRAERPAAPEGAETALLVAR